MAQSKSTAKAETAESVPLNLYQRINAIRSEVTRVTKDANVDGKYNAVTHDAVTKMIRPLMVKHGVVSFLSLQSSEHVDTGVKWKQRTCLQTRALFQITYVNIDNPEQKHSVIVEAHADEAGDKAPGKVASYAQKYADLKTFGIESGEDDEQRIDDKHVTVAVDTLSEEQLADLIAKADELFGDDAEDVLNSMADKVFRVGGYIDIQAKHFKVAIAKLEAKARDSA